MMQSVRGIYRGGVVELLEKPVVSGETEVVVTFLTAGGTLEADDGLEAAAAELNEGAPPLDDFEPLVPSKPVLLSDLVMEDRR